MPNYVGVKDTFAVLIDGYNVVTALDNATVHIAAAMDSFHPLGSAYPTAIATGEKTGEFSSSGILDSPTVDPISSVNGTPRVVSWLNEGNVITSHVGPNFYGLQGAMVSGVEVTAAEGTMHRFTPTFTVSGNVHYGTLVAPYVQRTSAGDTKATYATIKEVSGFPFATGHAFLNITELTLGAATSLTVTVTTSANHSSWSDQSPFTTATTIGGQYMALATVAQYLAVKWAWVGGAGTSWTGFVGIAVD